jgi:predicted MFS family arabinose efflux permease
MNASSSLAQLAGPSVAGVLVQIFTAPMPVVVDALSFLASAAGIVSIRRHEPLPVPRAHDLRKEIAEGIAALMGHPTLRALVLGNSVIILCYSAQLAIFLLFLARDVRLEPSVIGIVLAIGGAGSLLGALFAGRIAERLGLGPTFLWAAAVASLAFMGRAAFIAPQELAIAAIATSQFVALFCASLFNVNGPSLRQAMTPPHLLGRVNASYRFVVWGTGPVGAFIGGLLAQTLGAQSALLIAGVGFLGAFPIYLWSPLPRMRTLPARPA